MVLQIYTLSSTIFISITLHSRSTPFKEFHDGMVDRLILSLKWLNRNCPNLPVKGYRTNEFPVPQKSEKVQRNQQRMQGNSSWHGTSQKPRRSNGFKLHSKKGSHRACNYVFFPFGQHMPACSLNLGFGFDHPNKHFVYPDKCIKNVEFARSILGKIHENPMIFAAHGPPQLRCQTNATGISTKVVRAVHPPAKSQRLLYDLEKWSPWIQAQGRGKMCIWEYIVIMNQQKTMALQNYLLCMTYALFEKTWPIQVNSDMIHQENSPFKVMLLFWQHFELTLHLVTWIVAATASQRCSTS